MLNGDGLNDRDESVALEAGLGIFLCLLGAGTIAATIHWGDLEHSPLDQTINQLGQAVLIAGLLDLVLSSWLKAIKRKLSAPEREFERLLSGVRELLQDVDEKDQRRKLWSAINDMNIAIDGRLSMLQDAVDRIPKKP